MRQGTAGGGSKSAKIVRTGSLNIGDAVGGTRSLPRKPALSFHGCPGLERSDTADTFVPAGRARAETNSAATRHRLLSSNTSASLKLGRSTTNLSSMGSTRSLGLSTQGTCETLGSAPGLAKQGTGLSTSSGKGKGSGHGAPPLRRRALTQALAAEEQRKRSASAGRNLKAVTFHGAGQGAPTAGQAPPSGEPPAADAKPAPRRAAAGTGGSGSGPAATKSDTGGAGSPRDFGHGDSFRGLDTLHEGGGPKKFALEGKHARGLPDAAGSPVDASRLQSAQPVTHTLERSAGGGDQDGSGSGPKKGADRKPGWGTKVSFSSKFDLPGNLNNSDNLSTMSTATPPQSPRVFDSPASAASPGVARGFRVLPSVPDHVPVAGWEPPSQPLSPVARPRGAGQQALQITRSAPAAAAVGKPSAAMLAAPHRARSPDANKDTHLWREFLDKEQQAKFYHQGIYPNTFDQQVQRFLSPGPEGRAAQPAGGRAALTDRGVRLREGLAVREAVRPRRARSIAEGELDEAEFESFAHAAGCGCAKCRPQNYAPAGLTSVDLHKEAVVGSGLRGRHLHDRLVPTAEQDEAFLRQSLGRRVKSADARVVSSGMMPHRGVVGPERPAGEYDQDLHERVIAERQTAALEHHEEHQHHRGRCCQVALVVNPRPSDPPPPAPCPSKADTIFSSGEFSLQSVKRAAHSNQEIFRYEPGSPQEATFDAKARARSVPPELGEGQAAGASTAALSSRGLHSWQLQAPDFNVTLRGSPRGERLNNSANYSSVSDMFAAERRAQSERRTRLEQEQPFQQLCAQAAEVGEQMRLERQALKEKMKGSSGVASQFVWG